MKDVTSPFSYDQRDRFTFTKSEKNIVERLECLFKNGYGINIIYGDRGVGDSDIMMTDTINPLKSKFKGFHKTFKQDDLGLSLSSFLLN